MSTNYSEQIFQSIDTIISQRLNEVSFDKTEICEIISQDENNKNKYWVSNGSLKYEAYSTDENRKYLINQKVYVTIPQGNYDLRKLIIGSYSADEINENLYVNPFNHLVTSSSHNVSDINITTNTSGTSTSDSRDLEIKFNYSNTTNFDYIGLEFGLDTSSLQGTYKGTYSIELQIYNNKDEQLNTSRIILYNTDLYGNPYGLIPMLKFQHLFPFPKEIENITDIAKIRVLFAQDGNFEKAGDIKLQDIKLYFGYDSETITKDELQLILKKGEILRYTTNTTELERNLYLNWNHFDSFNTPYIFNEHQKPNIFNDYTVYWLHYVDGLGKNSNDLPDDIAWNWETIAINDKFNQAISLTTNYNTDQYKTVIKYRYKEEDEYLYVISNGIVFENDDVRAEPGAANSSEDSLRIKLDENDTGVYNVYGLDGRMMDSSYRGPHNIYFEFLDTIPKDRIAIDEATGKRKIVWDFPTENTMIKNPIPNEDFESDSFNTATFDIDTMYKPGAMNNRIWCTVTLVTGEVRRGSLTLQFGEAAAAGSNYAFNIDFIGHRTCMYATGEDDTVEVQATFTKQNGEVMTTPSINWSWMNNYESPITLSNSTGEKITLTYNGNEIPDDNYSILQAKINDYSIDNGLTTNLTAYLPIPIAKPEYNYISGATRVVYDSNGNTATYSRNPYKLYSLTDEIKDTFWDITPNPNDEEIKYDIFQLKTQKVRDEKGDIIGEEKTLLPLSYMLQEPPATCVYCMLDESIVWSQPILIMQNRWEYDLLNEWNGKLQSDDTNYVLAPLLGAGKKENNAFTGVIMGDLKLAEGKVTNTGLYGFKEGNRRFSFNDKGEAYIGTGDYYINFENDDLTIKAKNFDLNANNGALIISDRDGIKLGDKISINPNGTATIGGWNINANSFSHNSNKYYLGQGLSNQTVGDHSNLTLAFKAGNKFGVATDGTLYAKDGKFSGDISGSSGTFNGNISTAGSISVSGTLSVTGTGTIAGWNINTQSLQSVKPNVGNILINSAASGSNNWIEITRTASFNDAIFYITKSGELYVKGSGSIAGWNIDANSISKTVNGKTTTLNSSTGGIATNNLTVTGGEINFNNGVFKVYNNGTIEMSRADAGYFTLGPSRTKHPYVSALNVGYSSGGIAFTDGTSVSSSSLNTLAQISALKNWKWDYASSNSRSGNLLYIRCETADNVPGMIKFDAYKFYVKNSSYNNTRDYECISSEITLSGKTLTFVGGMLVGIS